MEQQDIKLLGQTYNTLTLIATKGEETIYMAECLKTLHSLYNKYLSETENKKEEE